MNQKKSGRWSFIGGILLSFSSSVFADITPYLLVDSLDSLSANAKFVTLTGYANPSCDENRILLESSDPDYRKEMFAMLLSALHARTPVAILFTVSGGQCKGTRVILRAN